MIQLFAEVAGDSSTLARLTTTTSKRLLRCIFEDEMQQ